MKIVIEKQDEEFYEAESMKKTAEFMVKLVETKLAKIEGSRDKEAEMESLKKALSYFEHIIWAKQQEMNAWEAGGKKRWKTIHDSVETISKQLVAAETTLDPITMTEYLEHTHRTLSQQTHKVEALSQNRDLGPKRVKELRKDIGLLLPRDSDKGWTRFTKEAAKIQQEIAEEERQHREAENIIRSWEVGFQQWRELRLRHQQVMTGSPSEAPLGPRQTAAQLGRSNWVEAHRDLNLWIAFSRPRDQ